MEAEQETMAAIETKAQAFVRLANPRVQSTLDKIRILGNLSNQGNYEYTDGQVDKIEAALTKAVADTISLFQSALGQTCRQSFCSLPNAGASSTARPRRSPV